MHRCIQQRYRLFLMLVQQPQADLKVCARVLGKLLQKLARERKHLIKAATRKSRLEASPLSLSFAGLFQLVFLLRVRRIRGLLRKRVLVSAIFQSPAPSRWRWPLAALLASSPPAERSPMLPA